ncbi:MAG: PSD1 and planctomycete cytochrome C domain-containing protein [Verrucomicrobiota bacterium]
MKSPFPGLTLALSVTAASLSFCAAAEEPSFSRDIRPILSDKCFQCHGPDDKGRKGDLRLDDRESALKGGKSGEPAFIPGQTGGGELLKRIHATDPDDLMPPKAVNKPLTPQQIELLEKWIAGGAKYEKHWAFEAPVLPAVPPPVNAAWPRHNEIDNFVEARLDGLSPAPEAPKNALFRRVSFDLTGLPPTVEELAAFLADGSPQAYENAVDRLIASPRYGERQARRWLDLARYADTNGYEKDRVRSIWPYRDWVIRSLNADMPYNEFTVDQIAGDLLPNPTTEQKTATGFHRNSMLNEEGGIDPLEFRYYAMVDRVATTGATWLGLTLQCAQCHTHKFDPITHHEYFGIMAMLNNADEPDMELPDPARDLQVKERAAKLDTLLAALPERWPAHQGSDADSRKESLNAAFETWLKDQRGHTAAWQTVAPVEARSNSPLLTVQPDKSVLVSGDITKADTYQLKFTNLPAGITALRLEVLPDSSLPARGPGMAYYEGPKGDFFMGEFQVATGGQPVKLASATESYAKNNFGQGVSAQLALDGNPETGWSTAGGEGQAHEAVFLPEKPLDPANGELSLTMMFGRHYACSLGKFRLSVTTQSGTVSASKVAGEFQPLLAKPEASVTEDDRSRLQREFLLDAPQLAEARKEIDALRKPLPALTTPIMRERPAAHPRPTFLHNRGEFTQPKEQVEPGVLAVLNPLPPDAPKNRLTFARWLVSRDNPLTARVTVNRAWAEFFGRGIVRTEEDFGYQSDSPTHPALLDWLAVKFMDGGWSLKKLHRLIVTSHTYRQDSTNHPEGAARDPDNKLLWRGPRLRLEAEEVRDGALQAAGLLSGKMYGPGVYPPQPASVTTEGTYGALAWPVSKGEDRYRRSLYTFAKRTAPFAFGTTFDAPTGEACIVRRDRSNTPLQALSLLNDATITEAAQALGNKSAAGSGNVRDRITQAALRCFSRTPENRELAVMEAFYNKQLGRFTADPASAAKVAGEGPAETAPVRAAWTLLIRAMLNMDEFITNP